MAKLIGASVCAFLSLWAAPALSQLPGTSDPDYKELLAYELTIPTLNKVAAATRNIAAAAKNDPRFIKQQSLEAEIKKLEAKEELSETEAARLEKLQIELEQVEQSSPGTHDAKTLSEMAAQFQKEPLLAKALADVGLPPREYAKFVLAYFQAAMVHGMIKSGMLKEVPKDLRDVVNMENVKFIAEHEAEFTAFAKEMEALSKPPQ